jgi:hypothetical protein
MQPPNGFQTASLSPLPSGTVRANSDLHAARKTCCPVSSHAVHTVLAATTFLNKERLMLAHSSATLLRLLGCFMRLCSYWTHKKLTKPHCPTLLILYTGIKSSETSILTIYPKKITLNVILPSPSWSSKSCLTKGCSTKILYAFVVFLSYIIASLTS